VEIIALTCISVMELISFQLFFEMAVTDGVGGASKL
jgi:hypothetical protein